MSDLKAELERLGMQVEEGETWTLRAPDLPPLRLQAARTDWTVSLSCPIPAGANAGQAATAFTARYGGRVTQQGQQVTVQVNLPVISNAQRLRAVWDILALLPHYLERSMQRER